MVEHKVNWEIDIAKIISIIVIILLIIFGYQQINLGNKVDSLQKEINEIGIQLKDNNQLIESMSKVIGVKDDR